MSTTATPTRLVLKRSRSRSERIVQLLSPDILYWLTWVFFLMFVGMFFYFAYGLYLAVRMKKGVIENAVTVVIFGFFLLHAIKGQLRQISITRRDKTYVLSEVVIEHGVAELTNLLGERVNFALADAEVRVGRNKTRGDAWVSFRGKDPHAPSYVLELHLSRAEWEALQRALTAHLAVA